MLPVTSCYKDPSLFVVTLVLPPAMVVTLPFPPPLSLHVEQQPFQNTRAVDDVIPR